MAFILKIINMDKSNLKHRQQFFVLKFCLVVYIGLLRRFSTTTAGCSLLIMVVFSLLVLVFAFADLRDVRILTISVNVKARVKHNAEKKKQTILPNFSEMRP